MSTITAWKSIRAPWSKAGLIYAAAGGEGRPALKLAAGGTTSET